jgi:hypothetical protein
MPAYPPKADIAGNKPMIEKWCNDAMGGPMALFFPAVFDA